MSTPEFTSAAMIPPHLPLLQPNGTMNPVWYQWFMTLFQRTGGTGLPPDMRSVYKQLQDVATVSEEATPDKAGALLVRVDHIEQQVESLFGADRPQAQDGAENCPQALALEILGELKDLRSMLEAGQSSPQQSVWGELLPISQNMPAQPQGLAVLTTPDGTQRLVAVY